jgi:wyosine [tRNA(Phe)-imidazoG37] synthetase (radical SAM superfamily)
LSDKKKYLYGPVPSRRLGRSLGVDIIPCKVCTLDCLYCQVGRTTEKTIDRKPYVTADAVEAELRDLINRGLQADHISIAGSGEPTLNSNLGDIINRIKTITSIPVAVVTNGTLLNRADVRADCSLADVVLPTLNAADQQTFNKINRPHPDINLEKHISGLCNFRKEYSGQIWLEVFIVEPFNTSVEQIVGIKSIIGRINPDKVQLNSAVRPTAHAGIEKLTHEKLCAMAEMLGSNSEVIADMHKPGAENKHHETTSGDKNHAEEKLHTLFSMLKRRPCSLKDICSAMNLDQSEAFEYVTILLQNGQIVPEDKDGTIYYKII